LYRFGNIFILTSLYVNVVRLMTTLSKVVSKSQKVSATYLPLSYNTKNRLHSTVSLMQNVTVQFQNYRLHRDILVLFHFLTVGSPHSENNHST